MTRKEPAKAKRYSKPPGPRTVPPEALPEKPPANLPPSPLGAGGSGGRGGGDLVDDGAEPPDALPPEAREIGPSAPSGDLLIPRALLLHQRRRLEASADEVRAKAKKETFEPLAEPWADMFEGAMYPATMGPDQVNDRMGYGERLQERRPGGRGILRTRSGSVPLDAEFPDTEKRELTGDDGSDRAPAPVPDSGAQS